MALEFTGERYLPSLRGQIYYEHLHRYAIAARFGAKKRVLDIASGEGYGAELLARTAESVIGVDIDEQVVEHARRRYYASNLRFLRGSVTDIPLADASVDVIASFETIEHVTEHERMLDEFRRVLVPDGIVVISSPNKLVYSDEAHYENPFHVKELYFSELRDLLVRRFRHVAIYGQCVTALSLVHPLAGRTSADAEWYNGADPTTPGLPTLGNPVYFLAVCSDEPLNIDASSAYLDPSDDLLAHVWVELNGLRAQLNPAVAGGSAAALTSGDDGASGAEHTWDAKALAPAAADTETVRAEHDAELERTRGEHGAELDRLRGEHAAEIERLRGEHGAELERQRADFEAEIERQRLHQEAALEASRVEHGRLIEELSEAHRVESDRVSEANLVQLALLTAEHESAMAQLRAELNAASDDARAKIAASAEAVKAFERKCEALREQLRMTREASVDAIAELEAERTRAGSIAQEFAQLRAVHTVTLREAAAAERALRAQVAELREAVEGGARDSSALRAVLSSYSWRVTSPLRHAAKLIRR